MKKLIRLLLLALLPAALSAAEEQQPPEPLELHLPLVSCSTRHIVRIVREDTAATPDTQRYRLTCYTISPAGQVSEQHLAFSTGVDYTGGYLNDDMLILTNNRGSGMPTLLVWNLAQNTAFEDTLTFPRNAELGYQPFNSRSISCTPAGCFQRTVTTWHNQEWMGTATGGVTLRLGATSPNTCCIFWCYNPQTDTANVGYSKLSELVELPHTRRNLPAACNSQ